MTELERQLAAALEKLSGQFERERTQHAAQIATLQRQVEHFTGQVTRLIADYKTLADRLRGALEVMRQHGQRRRPERDQGPYR